MCSGYASMLWWCWVEPGGFQRACGRRRRRQSNASTGARPGRSVPGGVHGDGSARLSTGRGCRAGLEAHEVVVLKGIARNEILERHAVGGVAELFRATDRHTGRDLIIKRMRPDLEFDPAISAGFFQEVQLALMSNHRNLVRGLARGTVQGIDWVALEFVHGHDLAQVLSRATSLREPVPVELSLFMVREALDARSDLFAVGCILYELICGEPAFSIAGLDDERVIKLHRSGTLNDGVARLPAPMAAVVRRACAIVPDDRFPSAYARRDAVDALRSHHAVEAAEQALSSWMTRLFHAA
jgi:serine/threonine protein kinase